MSSFTCIHVIAKSEQNAFPGDIQIDGTVICLERKIQSGIPCGYVELALRIMGIAGLCYFAWKRD
jgi:hypothetical protein